jgi:hypothetical protein
MIDTGTPLYRPVIVTKPRSEDNLNGFGYVSRWAAIVWALEGDPTVTLEENHRYRNKLAVGIGG